MTTPLVVGIDCSTRSCKAIAWDRDGQAVAEGRTSYKLFQPKPKWYEQDSEEWWRGTCSALKALLGQIDGSRLEALCITHQRESFVAVDAQGMPIRNAILWLDERGHAQVEELGQSVGKEQFHQITGKPLTPNPAISKIAWLAIHEPEVVARADKFLDAHAFLIHRLTGRYRSSLASGDPMGLVDMRSGGWSSDLVRVLGLQMKQLPELYPPGSTIGHVSEKAAQATGLLAGLPIIAGAGDGQCAGLGANAIGGTASLNLGTAVVSGTMSADYLVDRAFRTLYAPIKGNYYLETVIHGGVFTVNWFVDRFASDLRLSEEHQVPEKVLETEAAQIPRGATGLVLVPYWSHAMTPYWDSSASGITIGWTGAHGRPHFYRAILEGIAYEQRLVGDSMMEATGNPIGTYVALGGGSRSDLWCQIIADVTDVPVCRATTTEATCLGAGILAAVAAGWYSDALLAANAMTDTGERFTPDAAAHASYDRLFREVYEPLFPSLRPLIHRLTALSRTDQKQPTEETKHERHQSTETTGDRQGGCPQ